MVGKGDAGWILSAAGGGSTVDPSKEEIGHFYGITTVLVVISG